MRHLLCITICLGVPLLVSPLMGQKDMALQKVRIELLPEYTIYRTSDPLLIDGKLQERAWLAAPDVGEFLFPWWQEGKKDRTEARMLWDETYLYVAFTTYDTHISAVLNKRDDPVSKDDAVEVFVAPNKDDISTYFNFEFNALGTILDRASHTKSSSAWNVEDIQVAVTLDGTLNDQTDEDNLWSTEIAIPFSCFASFAPHLPPHEGDTWRLNLYRIGGAVNPQFSLWSDTLTKVPQYHTPERFGWVHFSTTLGTHLKKQLQILDSQIEN